MTLDPRTHARRRYIAILLLGQLRAHEVGLFGLGQHPADLATLADIAGPALVVVVVGEKKGADAWVPGHEARMTVVVVVVVVVVCRVRVRWSGKQPTFYISAGPDVVCTDIQVVGNWVKTGGLRYCGIWHQIDRGTFGP